ncbi:alpha/beta hydrolase [Sphingomonas sabuli]|uniref:Alpha/beta hydrolase n=2 Tax=Sphingomonas sabuli TaxID=2764186 RepID=A0A7G9L5X4_9SPHN|nr:alpha/beta hydrolase [Sphingomonas sabuli]
MTEPHYLDFAGTRLAYRYRDGASPTLVFLPGYASDMDGTKALAVDAFAEARGNAMLRFDYSGTGLSGGRFEDRTLGGWLDQSLAVIDALTDGPLILIGSSMGGWLALLIARQSPERVVGLVGIAAAPDFTAWGYSAEEKAALRADGRLEQPNPYGDAPQLTTLGFWRSGESLRLLDAPIPVDCPVRLVHGDADADVPVDIANRTVRQLRSADVQLTIIKGGEHRLSQGHEIAAILRVLAEIVETTE